MRKLIEKTRKVNSYRTAKHVVEKLLARNDKVMLNIGCGTDYKKGWINIDNNSDDNISKLDLNWDLRNPLPFPENSVDYIFNEHFMEHLSPEDGIRVNKDFLRVLKKNGVLRIATPNLKVMISNYLSVPISEDPIIREHKMDFIQTPAEWFNMGFSWWGHKWIYDIEELTRRLREAGFTKVTECKIHKSKYPELRKIETRDSISLVVEAKK